MNEAWHIAVIFASGLGIGAAVVSLGDKFLAWFFYLRLKQTEKKLEEAEIEIDVLKQWRMK